MYIYFNKTMDAWLVFVFFTADSLTYSGKSSGVTNNTNDGSAHTEPWQCDRQHATNQQPENEAGKLNSASLIYYLHLCLS